MIDDKYMTIQQAADTAGVKRITVLKWIERGVLRASRLGWAYVIDKKDLDRVIRNRLETSNGL